MYRLRDLSVHSVALSVDDFGLILIYDMVESYQLSHIYDNLFAPKLSGERWLDRTFRRKLQSRPKRQQ